MSGNRETKTCLSRVGNRGYMSPRPLEFVFTRLFMLCAPIENFCDVIAKHVDHYHTDGMKK